MKKSDIEPMTSYQAHPLEVDVADIVLPEEELTKPSRAFLQSVKDNGVLQPVTLSRMPGTRVLYRVIDGRRRVYSARKIGIKTIQAQVSDIAQDDVSESGITLLMNNLRSNNMVSELKALELLVHEGWTERQIAQKYGLTVAQVRSRMRLKRLIPELRIRLEEGTLLPTVAVRASKLHPNVQERMIVDAGEDRITFGKVKAARQAQGNTAIATTVTNTLFPESVLPNRADADRVDACRYIEQAMRLIPADQPVIEILRQALGMIEE